MENSTNLWHYIDFKAGFLKSQGRKLTAENYLKTKRRLRGFIDSDEVSLSDITEEFMSRFNSYLRNSGIQSATISFYNRCLRAIYNQAADEGLVKNLHPFDYVYTGIETRFVSVKVKNENGEHLNLDSLSKDDLIQKYKYLQRKYNTLVGKLSELVRA